MLNYKNDIDQKSNFLNPDLVSHFIDDLAFDSLNQLISFEDANIETTSLLHEKLNDEIQSFCDYFSIFIEDSSIENQNFLVGSLEKLKKSLVIFPKIYINPKFNFPNFPYQDLYQLILASDNRKIINLSFECITTACKMDLTFNVNSIEQPIIDKLLYISESADGESIEFVEFISILIQRSPELCNLFILNGLFNIFDNYIQVPVCIYCLESIIMTIDNQYIPTILIYCNELLSSDNRIVVEKSFHCFSLFILRFKFDSIDRKSISSLYEIIPNYVINSQNALELCLLIPNNVHQPPNILPVILETLKNPTADSKIHNLMLNLMVHFYSSWESCLKKEDITEILFFGAQYKEFETSVRFAECAILYHKFDDFLFDLSVFQICLDYLETEIHPACIFKIYEILTTDEPRFPEQISQMLDLMTSDVTEIITKYANEDEGQNTDESKVATLILELISSKFQSQMDD